MTININSCLNSATLKVLEPVRVIIGIVESSCVDNPSHLCTKLLELLLQLVFGSMAPTTPQVTVPVDAFGNPAGATANAGSMLGRAQKFLEENQKVILLGCAVAVSAGAGYYIYSGRSSPLSGPGSPGPSTSSKKSRKSKKKKGGKEDGVLKGKGSDGPVVEEIPGKAAELSSEKEAAKAAEVEKQEAGTSHLNGELAILRLDCFVMEIEFMIRCTRCCGSSGHVRSGELVLMALDLVEGRLMRC